jgi:hypothetical protein
MESYPDLVLGKPVIKSMPTLSHFHYGIGNGCNKPAGFWWRDVDVLNDRPVGNPKRRCDEHSSKFSLSYETKV